MKQRSEFLTQALDILNVAVGEVQHRAMFGGYSLFHGGSVFAIVVNDQLYFKVDSLNRDEFEKAGSQAFSYESKAGKPVTMSYWEAPQGSLDNPDTIRPWATLGIEAATRAAAKRKPKKR